MANPVALTVTLIVSGKLAEVLFTVSHDPPEAAIATVAPLPPICEMANVLESLLPCGREKERLVGETAILTPCMDRLTAIERVDPPPVMVTFSS